MFAEIQAWQSARLGKITASEMHRLMVSGKKKDEYFGKGALSYLDEKISELITGQPCRDLTGNYAIEWGSSYEHEAIDRLQKLIDIPVEAYGGQNNKFFPLNSYSGGSPDALTDAHLIEVKCPYNSAIHTQNLLASINDTGTGNQWMKEFRYEYYVQMQMNMMCTDRQRALFVSYDPRTVEERHRLAVLGITADNELQTEIIDRVQKGAEIISAALETLSRTPSLLIANYDQSINVTIVEPEINLSKLKKL